MKPSWEYANYAPGGVKIIQYCRSEAKKRGFDIDEMFWSTDLVASVYPYVLTIGISTGGSVEICFSRDEIDGYDIGNGIDAINAKVCKKLDDLS